MPRKHFEPGNKSVVGRKFAQDFVNLRISLMYIIVPDIKSLAKLGFGTKEGLVKHFAVANDIRMLVEKVD